jgi:hypothetical protein
MLDTLLAAFIDMHIAIQGASYCTAGGNQKLGPRATKHAADRDASPSRRCAGQHKFFPDARDPDRHVPLGRLL